MTENFDSEIILSDSITLFIKNKRHFFKKIKKVLSETARILFAVIVIIVVKLAPLQQE